VNSVPGTEHILSASSAGVSVSTIRFSLEKNIDVGFNEVQAKINQILPQLPDDADPPVIAKVEFGSLPVLWLALSGDRTVQQLNQYARNVIKKRIETIDGVGEVRIGGERRRTIRVNLDPRRMAQAGITIADVERGFQQEYARLPGGFMTVDTRDDVVKLDLEYHDPHTLGRMILAHREDAPIRLRDVARIEDGTADFRKYASVDGRPAVGIGIVKLRGANAVAIVDEVKRRIDTEIRPQLAPGVRLDIVHDDGDLIRSIVAALEEHVILGTLLTGFVVWVFLRNLRSTLIVAAAIPVSLLGAIWAMYVLGYTFNTMTLLGLLLLIGVVVDDAIVVLENIFRYREEHAGDPERAAVEGAREVVFPVVASTLTLTAIFGSVIFMEGIVGRVFQAFAAVVTVGVLVSLLVSMTLTPALCARHLRLPSRHGALYQAAEAAFLALDRAYRRLLDIALRHRLLVLALTLAALYGSGYFFRHLGKDFFPVQDEGRFQITLKTPLGASIDVTIDKLREVEAILARHPEVAGVFATVGSDRTERVTQAVLIVRLKPWDERTRSQAEVIERLRPELAAIPGAQAFPTEMPIVGGERGDPLQFVLTGPSLGEVARLATELRNRAERTPGMGTLDLDLQLDLPRFDFAASRERAAALGLSAHDAARALSVLAGGVEIGRFNDDPGDGERYEVRLKAGDGELEDPSDLGRIHLRSGSGDMVRLDNVARLQAVLGPAVVSRFDLQYAAAFYGTPELALGEAVAAVRQAAAGWLPPGYRVTMTARAEELGKTARYMVFAFVTALALVYMVLASQFNSFVQPVVIMVAQPLAIIGGAAALWLFGESLNIFSMIGLTLLVGLVAKNSILLVDLANRYRAAGMPIDAALAAACPVRLRPVLMTSLTVMLALLPAAIGVGAGSDTNRPLAIAVIGGMLSSTLLTLVVVPAAYSLVEHRLERGRSRHGAASALEGGAGASKPVPGTSPGG
jgi:HAE1 family hydrophobic/amphiphilic exporter-1